MKIIKLIFCLFAAYFLTGCENDYPLKKEQYDKFIYLSRVERENEIYNNYVNYAYDRDTVYFSVSASGTEPVGKNVTVTFKEVDEAISIYNNLNFSVSDIRYKHLPEEVYEYPLADITFNPNEYRALYPVYVYPEALHCDSLYMLPISIESVSAYTIREGNDSVLLARIIPVNNYSGDYYMDATIYNLEAGASTLYTMYRTAVATNKNTIRIYHETAENSQHLQSNTMTITFNDDNTVSFGSWNEFNLTGGSGTYMPNMKLIDFEYTYTSGDTDYRVKGYFYKRPDTELEQEEIEDWIRKERDREKQGG